MRSLVAMTFFLTPLAAQDVNEKNETAMREAALAVAPSVAKIETSGGREMASGGGPKMRPGMAPGAGVRKGQGPTTGLVVSADGYVITSAFNFANNPSDIFVTVPGQSRLVAKMVATDTTRMLTLLKVEAKGLPVPKSYPKSEMVIGQWSMALGRTLPPEMTDAPSSSAGIISALGRMHGKLVQTDAKVSPVNYGGPLVAIDGRIFGVLVPASPQGEGEINGVEWYDSGIGFAVPLEDVFRVLPKLKEGKDLRKGLMGIAPKTQDLYLDEPIIGTVSPESAALKAGLKAGDRVAKVDGRKVDNFFGVQVALGPKYEGDAIDVVVVRDGKELEFRGLVLTGAVTSFNPGFLGILPMRDDADPGVEIRYVFKDSPAEKAKLAVGDRIMRSSVVLPEGMVGPPVPVLKNRNQLLSLINNLASGAELNLEVKKGDKTEKLKVVLSSVPNELPEMLPLPSSKEKAAAEEPKKDGDEEKKGEKKEEKKDDEKKEADTGLIRRKNAVQNREHWIYVPRSYKPNISYGVVVWLHNLGKGGRDAEDVVKIWGPFCERYNFLMLGSVTTKANGWTPTDGPDVVAALKETIAEYTVDRARVAVHGEGNGGQMAAWLAFNNREFFRGAAPTGCTLGIAVKDNLPGQRLAFFLIAGDKHPDFKEIEATPAELGKKKFPTIWRGMKDTGKEYMDRKTYDELGIWLEMLDRI